ncbi:BnaCnng34470D [Brassica napus]|uniref:BnaCnng34470D protein n=1 Tax=Brassica napus TaxID=3708 RepID=A0A078J7M5_BRANA|nr:BnaCnng34470D [Brassica napus]
MDLLISLCDDNIVSFFFFFLNYDNIVSCDIVCIFLGNLLLVDIYLLYQYCCNDPNPYTPQRPYLFSLKREKEKEREREKAHQESSPEPPHARTSSSSSSPSTAARVSPLRACEFHAPPPDHRPPPQLRRRRRPTYR